jgi:cytochrome P450
VSALAPPSLSSPWPFALLLEYRQSMLRVIERARREKGDVVELRLTRGLRPLLLFDPQLVEQVLVGRAAKYGKNTPGYQRLSDLLGQGLLTSQGELWRRQRRISQPQFRPASIAGFAGIMSEEAESLATRWETAARSGEPFDAARDMGQLALAVVGRALFSADMEGSSDALGEALDDALKHYMLRLTTPIPGFSLLPTRVNRRGRRASHWLRSFVRGLVTSRRERDAPPDPPDLLSLLMSAGDEEGGMSEELLEDECLTMLLAGHETTANALSWTHYLLGRNPDVVERLEAEVDAVLGERRVACFEDVERLPYTWQVVQESMRLYPPAWVIARSVEEDDVLGGYEAKAGSFVLLCQHAIHRHPALWSEPSEFRPQRFAPEGERASLPRFAYFPFGGGQRLCLGAGFARQEAVIVLATLARRFRLELVEAREPTLEASVTLRPREGVWVRARMRESAPF